MVLGAPAKALRIASALAPGLTGAMFSIAARLLPGPAGDPLAPAEPAGAYRRAGGVLTRLGDAAAAENNEVRTLH